MAASLNMFCSWTNQLNTWDFLELASFRWQRTEVSGNELLWKDALVLQNKTGEVQTRTCKSRQV